MHFHTASFQEHHQRQTAALSTRSMQPQRSSISFIRGMKGLLKAAGHMHGAGKGALPAALVLTELFVLWRQTCASVTGVQGG